MVKRNSSRPIAVNILYGGGLFVPVKYGNINPISCSGSLIIVISVLINPIIKSNNLYAFFYIVGITTDSNR